MVRAWKMHFLPVVELLAKFPCMDCTDSPSAGTNQLFRFLLLSHLRAPSAHAEQPGELHWNCEFWSTAQRPDLPSKCRELCSRSVWEKASCAGGWEPRIISSFHSVGEDLPSASSFIQLGFFTTLWFHFFLLLRLHLSWILHWITVWNGSAISTLCCYSRRVPQRS